MTLATFRWHTLAKFAIIALVIATSSPAFCGGGYITVTGVIANPTCLATTSIRDAQGEVLCMTHRAEAIKGHITTGIVDRKDPSLLGYFAQRETGPKEVAIFTYH